MEPYIILWIVSLVIGLVVIGVVAFLLHQIKSTAKTIDGAAAQIWTQGKLTANNTIQIPIFLSTTNKVVGKIYDSAVKIIKGSDAIKQHAKGCPGCPRCILEHKKA
tara:strand:+ start:2376 stop:2693 length:318 start_codon:yes stop_codon:yes gene_type:complete